MDFTYSDKTKKLVDQVKVFMDAHIYPIEKEMRNLEGAENSEEKLARIKALKPLAREQGLWNLFMPVSYGQYSAGLTNVEYAPLAEEMGRIGWAPEVFNCAAPNTGNMEVFAKFGTDEQKAKWLDPMLNGALSSAFLMTEPQVASSDATNIETRIERDGDEYVINGRKWWASGIFRSDCEILILMGKTDFDAPRHQQQSMIVVPKDTPGLEIIRPLPVMNAYHYPSGHGEVKLDNVRVPASNLLLGEGRGFEIAQGRLGPGRVHHCMRLIGQAERAFEYMCRRITERETFGKNYLEYSSIRQEVAKSRCDIEQARLMTLATADKIDKEGAKAAKDMIAMIKIIVPEMTAKVADRAIQIFGGKGFTNDTPLVEAYIEGRYLQVGDGPSEVHMYQLGRNQVKKTMARDDLHVPYFDEI